MDENPHKGRSSRSGAKKITKGNFSKWTVTKNKDICNIKKILPGIFLFNSEAQQKLLWMCLSSC